MHSYFTRQTFLDTLQVIQRERGKVEAWIEARGRGCERVRSEANTVRLTSARLDSLPRGQSIARSALEKQLWRCHEDLRATVGRATERPSTHGLKHVDWSSHYGFSTLEPYRDESDWNSDQQIAFAREVGRLKDLVQVLNDNSLVEQARFEATQAGETYRAALRRSARSPGEPSKPRLRRSGAFAAIPFVSFLVASGVGIFFEPAGLPAWITFGFLFAAVAIGAWGALREGPRVGVLAGLGASASLALFMPAYIACRAFDAESIVRSTGDALPVHSIGEVGLVTLTVGLTGDPLGAELEGTALIVAFIQILLTISAVAAIAAVGWRVLMARTERPDSGPDNEDQLIE
jgi:hypothetical protein